MINKKIKIKKIQKEFLLNSLFKSKNFYGSLLNKKQNIPFIYGCRHNFSIINLKITSFYIQKILFLLKYCLKKKKNILIIGNSFDINFLLNKKNSFINKNKNIILYKEKWIKGLITNEKIFNFYKKKKIKLIFFLKTENKIHSLFTEFNHKNIPIISLVNTDFNINLVNYPIFTNTKNLKSLFFLLYLIRKIF
jgi:ribosomal protein S2